MRPGTTYSPVLVNYTFEKRGIGDIICALKVIQTIRKKWPHVFPILWVPDFFVELGRHMLKDYLKGLPDYVGIFPWSEMKEKMRTEIPVKSFRRQNLNSWRVPLMKHNYLWLSDYYPEDHELDMPIFDSAGIDLNQFDLPQDYVVVVTTFNARNKEFLPEHIQKIVNWVNNRGLKALLLGRTEQTYIHNGEVKNTNFSGTKEITGALSLVNKTNLLEAGAILSKARAVVGIDGGLIHLAACSSVPIVCGFTVVKPKLFTPQRKGIPGKDFYIVEPEESLGCRFCHSQINFINHGDVFDCFYSDYICLKQMTGDKFIKQLEKII